MTAVTDSSAVARRLRYWRTELEEVSVRELAEGANEYLPEHQQLTQRTLANYERPRPDAPHHGPRVEHVLAIQAAYPHLNLRWLLTGEGPPVVASGFPELGWLRDSEEALPVLDAMLRQTTDVSGVPLTARYQALQTGVLPVLQQGSATIADVTDAVEVCGARLGVAWALQPRLSPEHGEEGGRPTGSFLARRAGPFAQEAAADAPKLDRWQLRCLRSVLQNRCTLCGYSGPETLHLVKLGPESEPPLSRMCLLCPNCHRTHHSSDVDELRRLTRGREPDRRLRIHDRVRRLVDEQVARAERRRQTEAGNATEEDLSEEPLHRAASGSVAESGAGSDEDVGDVP